MKRSKKSKTLQDYIFKEGIQGKLFLDSQSGREYQVYNISAGQEPLEVHRTTELNVYYTGVFPVVHVELNLAAHLNDLEVKVAAPVK